MATPAQAFVTKDAATQADAKARADHRTQRLIAWTVAVTAVLFLMGVTAAMFWRALPAADMTQLATDHFMGLFGPPMCTMVALVVVIVLRVTHGAIEFEVLGVKFKGASGPVVLYILTYLAGVIGMVALWKA